MTSIQIEEYKKTLDPVLVTIQEKHEESALSAGKDAYLRMLTIRGQAESKPGVRLMRATVDPFITAITNYIKDATEGRRRGPRNGTAILLKDIEPTALAMLAMRTTLQYVEKKSGATTIGVAIGRFIEEHVEWVRLREEKLHLARVIEKRLATRSNEEYRRAVARNAVQTHVPERKLGWDDEARSKVGMVLLELMKESTQLISITHTYSRARRSSISKVDLTEKAMEFLKDGDVRSEMLKPLYAPTVVPPVPWSGPYTGGYFSRQLGLVKTHNQSYTRELGSADLTLVYRALNALQNTAYRINRGVLAVLAEAVGNGDTLGGLVREQQFPIPAKPHDIETNEEARAEWKREAALTHEMNYASRSKYLAQARKVEIAQDYMDYERIYFPHQLDWRGRAYPVPVDLQPQGDDVAKALLQYADGKPLGEEGVQWLKVHIANLFGVDKVSFLDRQRWVDEHSVELLDSALRPLDGDRFWCEADDPWMALAACFEFAGMLMQGPDYVSHLVVAVDGSCNGLQNLSAMLRDEVGGQSTNLLPSDKPQDVYQLVADRTTAKLTGIASLITDMDEHDRAMRWLSIGISRKLVKRPVMTKPYGVTPYGMRDQLMKVVKKEKLPIDKDDVGPMCALLARVVDDVIGEVVIASREVMDWLQETASIAAAANLPLWWMTPIGLPVLQDYRRSKGRKVEVWVGGQRKQFKIQQLETDIDAKRQSLGASPNVIHSLDASHMMLTVLMGLDAGLDAYTMIHDSYGTHACNVGELSSILRLAFVEMYRGDVLGELREQFVSQVEPSVAEQIPPLPKMGTLDLEAVQDSLYFFA